MEQKTVLKIDLEGDETHPGGVGVTNLSDLIVVDDDFFLCALFHDEFGLLDIWQTSNVNITKIHLLYKTRRESND